MPEAAPLVDGSDAVQQQCDGVAPSRTRSHVTRFAKLEADRDALRAMLKQVKAKARFSR